jgi:hypothetical protein
MTRVLREQPLAVAAAGLAAGAAIAAVFPSMEIEERTLGRAGESLRDAAQKARERVKDATVKPGEPLKDAAEERGLTSEGLKDLAGDVADTFTSAVSGKADDHSKSSVVPEAPASMTAAGQGVGAEQSEADANRKSTFAQTGIQPGRSSDDRGRPQRARAGRRAGASEICQRSGAAALADKSYSFQRRPMG